MRRHGPSKARPVLQGKPQFSKAADLKPLSEHYRNVVRQTLEDYSSDSKSFRTGKDVFYSVEGLGAGVWGLRELRVETPIASDISETGPEDRVRSSVYRVLRDTVLARNLKVLCKHECQVCGSTVVLPDGSLYSEVHHLQPLGNPHNGPDIAENIVVVCPNHHVEFDYGVIGVDPDSMDVNRYDGQNLGKLRAVERFSTNKAYLGYHWSKIFNKTD